MKKIYAFSIAIASVLSQVGAHAGNARDEFSLDSNPNGNWSYGSTASLGGSFSLLSNKFSSGSQSYWYGTQPAFGGAAGYPIIGLTNSPAPAGELLAHPGPRGEYAVLRWTAPADGLASVLTKFSAGDSHPTTTDVHILLNGNSISSGSIAGSSDVLNFSQTLTLLAGDKIDFAVGYGSNLNYLFDSTFVLASVTSVPEPSSLALLFAGMGLIILQARRLQVPSAPRRSLR